MKIKMFTLPNLLTLSNLLCGSFAAVAILEDGNFTLAFWLVIAAAVCDFFDGFVARLLHCSSPIGGELDSLADMVSFGLVPALVAYRLFVQSQISADIAPWIEYVGVFLCFTIVAFSALRLAKFNIDETQHTEFEGLPTPANSLFFVSLGYIWANNQWMIGCWIALVALGMGWMLISPVRMFALKFKGFGWQGNQIRYIFILMAVALVIALKVYAVPAIIVLYILISTVRWCLSRSKDCK